MRSTPVTVYLTDEQRAMLENHAATMGMSLSAYMRWRATTDVSWSQGTNQATGHTTFTWTANSSVQNREVK